MVPWPQEFDEFVNPSGSQTLLAGGHAALHSRINDAVEALQRQLGTNPPVSPEAFGALGNGTADDRAALLQADASPGGSVLPAGRVFLVSSNTELTGRLWAEGGLIRPANGVTITISGKINAGLIQVFDLSLGGTVTFSEGSRVASVVRPEWWGALADDEHDDAPSINAAYAAATAQGDSYFSTLEFAPGRYLAASRLNFNISGSYVNIRGWGIRQTRITFAHDESGMLLSAASGVHARKLIEGITFDGDHTCPLLLDGSDLRYSKLKDCEFINTAAGGWAFRGGNWVMRVENCMFNGQDASATRASNAVDLVGPLNNIVFKECSVTSCVVGVRAGAYRSLVFRDGTFDSLDGAGILLTVGGDLCTIAGCYFENVGKTGTSVQTAASTFETWQGSIIAHHLYTTNAVGHQQLNIHDNQFVNCPDDQVAVFDNIYGLAWRDNNVDDLDTDTDHLVALKWLGAPSGRARRVYIEHIQAANNQFLGGLVRLADVDPEDNTCAMVIRDRRFHSNAAIGSSLLPEQFPLNWSVVTAPTLVAKSGRYEGIHPVWTTEGDSLFRLDITPGSDGFSNLLGRYFRVHYMTKGGSGASNGIIFRLQINTGSGLSTVMQISRGGEDWTGSRLPTFYVPTNATQVRMEILDISTSSPIYFTKFAIVPASLDLDEVVYTNPVLKVSALPTGGTWEVGDVVEFRNPSAGGWRGGICTAAPATFENWGAIEA